MLTQLGKTSICLWFDRQAQEAAKYYTSIFKRSRIIQTNYYGNVALDIDKKPVGSVLTVEFELEDQRFVALNGGPEFKSSQSTSVLVNCDSQEEIDYYWNALSRDGDPYAQQCGWLKDKFGVSWQIVPKILNELIGNPESKESDRAMDALLKMKKLEIDTLMRAYTGKSAA